MSEKKSIRYCIVEEPGEFGIEYGILCKENGVPYMTIKKISPDKATVREMIRKFNNMKLDSKQFYDEVEDMIP